MNQPQHDVIENVLYDEIEVGQSARLVRTLTLEDIRAFAAVSGDVNPAHLDTSFANESMFHGVIGHGMWTGSLVSTVLGTVFPGPGTIYLEQSFRFKRPVRIGDTLTVIVTVAEKNDEKHSLLLDCVINNQNGDQVVVGQAKVMAPTEKIIRPRMGTPKLNLFDPETRVQSFIASLEVVHPISVGIIHPTDQASLTAALEMAETGKLSPVLIGPELKIRGLAEELGIDLQATKIVDAEHSHQAALIACEMAVAGDLESLHRGNLDKNEIVDAIRQTPELHTKSGLSHVFRFDVPLYDKPLLLTDAVLHHKPTLTDKVVIVQNAICVAQHLGIETPKVALLSAVEKIDSEYQSTLDAAALCKMADRKQITGGELDGPIAFDQAVSDPSDGIGYSDVLVAPDNESANMLAKQLEYFAGASSCGILVGARVPVGLAMRSASVQSQVLSAIFAGLIAERFRSEKP
jgi:phosphate acetyltransferase